MEKIIFQLNKNSKQTDDQIFSKEVWIDIPYVKVQNVVYKEHCDFKTAGGIWHGGGPK
jgi:hypothetical protein